jgi:hypothetical protein
MHPSRWPGQLRKVLTTHWRLNSISALKLATQILQGKTSPSVWFFCLSVTLKDIMTIC